MQKCSVCYPTNFRNDIDIILVLHCRLSTSVLALVSD